MTARPVSSHLSCPVGYSVYVLPNPYRVMIDLPDVILELPANAAG